MEPLETPVSIPLSTIPGEFWPAVPGTMAAQVLAILFQLEHSQWLTPEQLWARQSGQLDLLLRHAFDTVPWYRDRFTEVDYRPGEPLTRKRWTTLPLLSREELQRHGDALRSNAPPASHGPLSHTSTSGSTGRAVVVTKTALLNLMWRAITLRDHHWHRRDLGGKLAAIRAFQDKNSPAGGLVTRNWGAATRGIFDTGPGALLKLTTDVARQAAWLRRQDPDYLLTYPSNLRVLADHFQAGGGLPGLKQIRTVGETLSTATREICHTTWGVPVVDMYTSEEMGYLALQCPDHDHYHVQSENVLVEILDEDGNPCSPGHSGRVVATSLHNFAMPLIRYALEDFAEVGEPCPCGRGLPTIKRILGRERNLVRFPDGTRHWPVVGFAGYRDIAPVSQFQFTQKTLEDIHVRLVVERPLTTDEEGRLKATIRQALGHPFNLDIEYLDHIPMRPGGKFEDFVSEVE